MVDEVRKGVRARAHEHIARGEPLGWFEPVYAAAAGDPRSVPWADGVPNPGLVQWLDLRSKAWTPRGRALVVGCGLGDDAEELSRYVELSVVAFDLSPTAIAWAKRRAPGTSIDYRAADLFALPAEWTRAFDFVFEAYTVQSLPASLHAPAMAAIARTVAKGGTLLVIARGRDEGEAIDGPPWPLARTELSGFASEGLREVAFDEYDDAGQRRFRAEYRRA